MSTTLRVSRRLIERAKIQSKVENRSVTGQIEYWAKIGKIAEENPDLSFSQIKEIMIGLEQLESDDKTEYKFG
jgi:ParD-like antitoxin of type II bacterial toxin-antitoxin system